MAEWESSPFFFCSASFRACLSLRSSLNWFISCSIVDSRQIPHMRERVSLTLPDFRLRFSFTLCSFSSSSAFFARFAAIFSRKSFSFSAFSSSVNGLI